MERVTADGMDTCSRRSTTSASRCADFDEAVRYYADMFGMTVAHEEINEEQGVREAMLSVGDSGSSIQLLAPLSDASPIAKFLDQRGPGIQQLAYRVRDLDAVSATLRERGAELLYDEPSRGTAGLAGQLRPPQVGRRRPGRTGGAASTSATLGRDDLRAVLETARTRWSDYSDRVLKDSATDSLHGVPAGFLHDAFVYTVGRGVRAARGCRSSTTVWRRGKPIVAVLPPDRIARTARALGPAARRGRVSSI